MNAKILYAGKYSGRKSVTGHFHRGMELVYSVSGHCANRTPAGTLDVYPGEVTVIPPKLQHRQIDFGEVVTFYVVFDLGESSFLSSFRVIALHDDAMSGVWFRQLFELYEQHRITECNKLLELVLLHLQSREMALPEKNNTQPQLLQQAVHYAAEHFKEGISAGDVALACRCSETYLNTLFNRYYGKSISRHLAELRLSLARRLLLHSPLSTKEISAECGYSRSNYFCRIFRQEHGCTPKKFRMKQGSFDYNSQPSSD